MDQKLKVLIVDDSPMYRMVVGRTLDEIDDVEIIGRATDGQAGYEMVQSLKPDLITLDVEMPRLDGLSTLKKISELPAEDRPAVIMVSTLTKRGATAAIKATVMGAFDCVAKPEGLDAQESFQILSKLLKPRVEAFKATQISKLLRQTKAGSVKPDVIKPASGLATRIKEPRMVVMGISTGGPNALMRMLPKIPGDFGLPILIVQHMPPVFTKTLADDLNRACAVNVVEGQADMQVQAGTVYIAPGGQQMKLANIPGGFSLVVNDDPPVDSCKPSVNYLFDSAAEACRGHLLAVMMTGMGDDGLKGCKTIRQKGGNVIAQNEETCVVYGMPKVVVDAGLATGTFDLENIAGEVSRLCQKRTAA